MNETEAERIALAINVLRPDWPASSLKTLLARPQLAGKPRRDVAVAMAWVAAESESTTPARVLEAGPWWQAVAVESGRGITRYPPKRGEDCPVHAGEWPESCRGCASERLAPVIEIRGEHHATGPLDVRAQLRLATAHLCGHGPNCQEDHDDPTTDHAVTEESEQA